MEYGTRLCLKWWGISSVHRLSNKNSVALGHFGTHQGFDLAQWETFCLSNGFLKLVTIVNLCFRFEKLSKEVAVNFLRKFVPNLRYISEDSSVFWGFFLSQFHLAELYIFWFNFHLFVLIICKPLKKLNAFYTIECSFVFL